MSTIRRGLRILELLAAEPDGLGVSEIARSLALNRAIPFRLLAEFMEMGYVRQDPVTDRYVATFKLGALGLQQLERAGIDRWAQACLRDLAEETQELVRLAVVEDGGLRWVAKAQGSSALLIINEASIPHATASGKAWLSTLPVGEAKSILNGHDLERPTSHTMTEIPTLLADLDEARTQGYAVVEEEMEVGINAIAVPVIPVRMVRAVATVSVAGPSVRLTRDRLIEFAPRLLSAAADLAGTWSTYAYLTRSSAVRAGVA
jgi:IclR family acetate operon transcriptional repressor